MLLVVGWRGRPGEHDEPEHALAGPRTLELLSSNGFPYEVLPDTLSEATSTIARLIKVAREENTPVALVVPNHRFAEYRPAETGQNGVREVTDGTWECVRVQDMEAAFKGRGVAICRRDPSLVPGTCHSLRAQTTSKDDVTVSSVGGNSREIYMIRKENNEDLSRNFLSIGAMGHTYPLAFGVQIGHPSGRVICIEGDGSFLMHVSNAAVLAAEAPSSLIHVVIHNGMHCSTGGQAIPINTDNLLSLASSLPYKQKFFVDTAEGLVQAFEWAEKSTLIVVVVNQSVQKTLPRPSEHPYELRGLIYFELCLNGSGSAEIG